MLFYHVERNDDCPCGSGRKYKKCCLARVEEATRLLSQAVGPESLTATGRDIVVTLGYLCGLRLDEGEAPIDLNRVGRLLREAWEDWDRALEAEDSTFFIAKGEDFEKLLKTKKSLRDIYIPALVLAETLDGQDEDEEEDTELERLVEKLASNIDEEFLIDALERMALSLPRDDWADAEIKTLLTALSWAINDSSRRLFLAAVLEKTINDLEQGEAELQQVITQAGPTAEEARERAIREVLERYPAYADFIYAQTWEDAYPALQAISEGKLLIEMPLYALIGGTYALIAFLGKNLSRRWPRAFFGTSEEPWLEEVFWEQNEGVYFIDSLLSSLQQHLEKGLDEELARAVEKLMTLISLSITTGRVSWIEGLYLRLIFKVLRGSPLALSVPELEQADWTALFDEQTIDRYAGYLVGLGKEKEGEHVRQQFERWGRKAQVEYEAMAKEVRRHLGQIESIS